MLPGPNYVYKCPNCGNLLTRGSLKSGNSIGEKIYSDGKRIAPMLPEFPDLTKCKKCDKIFWLSKIKNIGTYDWGNPINPKWQNADAAEFLGIDDFFKALESGIAEKKEDEFFIRQGIWHAYNDRVRKGINQFIDENDEIKWEENCKKLISLLDQTDLNERIMIAELKRNLGDFEGCIDIIKKIKDKNVNWLKDKFILECERKNKLVIRLN